MISDTTSTDRSDPLPVVEVSSARDFGRALRDRRKKLGHTLSETAALCRVGVRFLSELERGKPTAELGRALKVAQRLGLDVRLQPRRLGNRSAGSAGASQ